MLPGNEPHIFDVFIWTIFFAYGPGAGIPNAQGAKPAGKARTTFTLNIKYSGTVFNNN